MPKFKDVSMFQGIQEFSTLSGKIRISKRNLFLQQKDGHFAHYMMLSKENLTLEQAYKEFLEVGAGDE